MRRTGLWTCGSIRSQGSGSCVSPTCEPYPFPSFPGREVLIAVFVGPGGESAVGCYVHDLYKGRRMRPERLAAWQALRERYGNRDESSVNRGTLQAPAA